MKVLGTILGASSYAYIKMKNMFFFVTLIIKTKNMYVYPRELDEFKPNSCVSLSYSLCFEVHLTPNVMCDHNLVVNNSL